MIHGSNCVGGSRSHFHAPAGQNNCMHRCTDSYTRREVDMKMKRKDFEVGDLKGWVWSLN